MKKVLFLFAILFLQTLGFAQAQKEVTGKVTIGGDHSLKRVIIAIRQSVVASHIANDSAC